MIFKNIAFKKMVGFYYNDYNFDEGKKYLILCRGSFGPPTKGHCSLVEAFIDLPNVKYFISQIGSEKRHGVPHAFSRKMWKIYIDELYSEHKDKIILKKFKSTYDVLDYVTSGETVIFLRGDEEEISERKKMQKKRLRNYDTLIRKLKEKGVGFDFLFLDRPLAKTLSTTKFVEAILDKKSTEELKFFLPKGLSTKTCRHIVKKLRTFPLK
jgi:hypothetical protein